LKGIPSSAKDHAPILNRSATEIRFRVDEVEPCKEPCQLTNTQARIRRDIGRPLLACSVDESSEVILAGGAARHGLVDAVYVAFSQHRPLVLTPDALWITIAQGLIAGSALLFLSFPKAYAAGFSGFYLGLIIVLWLLRCRDSWSPSGPN